MGCCRIRWVSGGSQCILSLGCPISKNKFVVPKLNNLSQSKEILTIKRLCNFKSEF